MAKFIFLQHQFLEALLDKQGFYKTPEEIDAAIDFASLSRFQELYGDDAEYQPGVPLPRRAYQVTQDVNDKLQPFLREVLFTRSTLVATPGQLPTDLPAPTAFTDGNKLVLPTGWVHPTAMHFIGPLDPSLDGADTFLNYLHPLADVKVVNDDKQGRRRRSLMVGPTQKYPISQVVRNGYRIVPLPDFALYVKYLARPDKPKWAFTLDPTTGDVVYDDANSVDTGWPEIDHNDMLMKAAEVLGVPMQDAQLMNFARYKAAAGA